jgi:hypothetical protein
MSISKNENTFKAKNSFLIKTGGQNKTFLLDSRLPKSAASG